MPAGFVDAGEDPRDAIERECLEEMGLSVVVDGLMDVVYGQEHSKGAHIIIIYRVNVHSGSLKPGDDVDRVKFFELDKLPQIAFKTTNKVIEMLQKPE